MNKTLSVAAIETGTVIDHIPAGQGINVLRVLNLIPANYQVTLGLNLSSNGMDGYKDLIKIAGRWLTEQEAGQVSIFAPNATVNIIENFKVASKVQVRMPEVISGLLLCPNPKCVTRHEAVTTCFHVQPSKQQVGLFCVYCERSFACAALEEYAR
jgi:aspartate carbamoyltransferase regulatory subunit